MAERDRWARMSIELGVEVGEVDVYDQAAVRAKASELSERLRALRSAA